MGRLVAVGACYLDTILTVDQYPAEDEKLRASRLVRRRGGNCPNSVEVLQQLLALDGHTQLSLVLLAVLPARSSRGTEQIRSSLPSAVDLTHCIYREDCDEPASSYIIKSLSTGSRTIVNYNELPEMTGTEFIAAADRLGGEASWYHFEGRIPEVTLECMRYLRRCFPSVKISVEVEKPGRAGLQELASEADIVFYSKSWAQGNGYPSLEECLKQQAAFTSKSTLLFCTWGQEGAGALEVTSMKYWSSPAYTPGNGMPVTDTVGAGDTFIAGILYGLICHADEWTLSEKLRFDNMLAGYKVVQEGFSGLGEIMLDQLRQTF